MIRRGLAALYHALRTPTGPHLDDQTLAAIVDAELAGENIEQLYQEQMAHIESCESCAAAYSELLLMMQGIISEMAEAAESSDKVTTIWNRALTVTGEYLKSRIRLTLAAPLPQLGEPKPAYDAGDERHLTQQTVPGPTPLTLKAKLSRLTPLTCRLTVHLQGEAGAKLEGYQVRIRYNEIHQTAETDPTGTATFDAIPIVDLIGLEIEVEE